MTLFLVLVQGVFVEFSLSEGRLAQGDDPLDVIESALAEGRPRGGSAPPDPLADYRL